MQSQPMQPFNNPIATRAMNNQLIPGNTAQQDPLSQLRDIHVPPDVSIWPLDWGWWCLIIFVVAVTYFTVQAIHGHILHNRAKKHALNMLKTISSNDESWPQLLNTLLKRVALSYYPKNEVASLHGDNWFTFLRNQCNLDERARKGFHALEQNLYRKEKNNSAFVDCFHATAYWINKTTFPKGNPLHLRQRHGARLVTKSNASVTSTEKKTSSSEVHNA